MNDPGSQDARRSVALVERLLEVEERVQTLVRDNLNLQRDLTSGLSHRSIQSSKRAEKLFTRGPVKPIWI